jgi:hypothetical protein
MTIFDYTSGDAVIQVESVTPPKPEELRRVEWDKAISRTRRSEGRMELQVVRMCIGGNKDPRFAQPRRHCRG